MSPHQVGILDVLQEVKLLERIELACEEQLANVFENYYALVESAPYGLADNGNAAPEQPAPALRPAVGLCRERPKPAQSALCSAAAILIWCISGLHHAYLLLPGIHRPCMAARAEPYQNLAGRGLRWQHVLVWPAVLLRNTWHAETKNFPCAQVC